MKLVRQDLVGNTFLHPVFDYIAIGSVWSILVTVYWLIRPSMVAEIDSTAWIWARARTRS